MAANILGQSFVECTHYGEIEPAWHGLGKQFDDPMTIEFAMKEANADFEVSKQPVIGLTPELVGMMERGEQIDASILNECIIRNVSCNMRMDNKQIIAVTGESYGVIQNIEAFRFINNICGVADDAPVIDTMGVLTDGTTFATIRMKSVYDLGGDDEVDFYLTVKNGFNNKQSLQVCLAPIRSVCQNTLNAAFANAHSKMFIRHTRNAVNRLQDYEDAARTLKLYNIYKEAFVENMEKLKKIKISDKQAERIICHTLMNDDVWKVYVSSGYNRNSEGLSTRTKNLVENALNVLHTGIGQNLGETGTGLHLYNGMTTLFNNHIKFQSQEKKFNSIFGGMAEEKQQTAFNLILAEAA